MQCGWGVSKSLKQMPNAQKTFSVNTGFHGG